jgi:long-chain acyl-CoA synthetase
VLAPGADAAAVVRAANARLEDHQRVWSTSIWPGESLPRTEGTQKLKRKELQRWAESGATDAPPRSQARSVEDVVARFAAGRTLTKDTTLDEIGLSSLDRVEMLMALEEAFQTTLDERMLADAKTIADLDRLVRSDDPAVPRSEGAAAVHEPTSDPIDFPSWNRTRLSWFLRRISLPTWILPLARVFMRLKVEGLEHLAALKGPVVFASNHQSHMDGPAVLIALPRRWRYWVAPAMAKEFFRAHFYPEQFTRKQWFTNSLNYYLSAQFFNTFPIPQREAGTRQTLRYMGEVLADGYSILIFPEGKRMDEGQMAPFRAGIGMIGARLEVPVVPVRIQGADKVLHPRWKWPKRGPVRIAFGAPLRLTGEDYPALAKQVEEAVKKL